MTPENMERIVAEFREENKEANLLRISLRGLLDDLRAVHDDLRRLFDKAGDEKTAKRPALELVKSEPAATDDSQSKKEE